MESDSRKRPYDDGDESVQKKKRVVADQNGSPAVNGIVEVEIDESANSDGVEVHDFFLSSSPVRIAVW